MDKFLHEKKKQLQSREAMIEAQGAINEEVKKHRLEYAELSTTMRELLSSVYIRGGLEVFKKIKIEMYVVKHQRPDSEKSA